MNTSAHQFFHNSLEIIFVNNVTTSMACIGRGEDNKSLLGGNMK